MSIHPEANYFVSTTKIILNPDGYRFRRERVIISKGCRIGEYVLIVPYGVKLSWMKTFMLDLSQFYAATEGYEWGRIQ